MAVSLDSLVDLAVSTAPQSHISLPNLNDLLHSLVRWIAASAGQGGGAAAEGLAKLPPLLDKSAGGTGHSAEAGGGDGAGGAPAAAAGSTASESRDGQGSAGAGADGADGGSGGAGDGRTPSSGSPPDAGVNSPCLYALSEGEVRLLENKLKALESRLDTLHSLDDLQKRAADGATPLADMWNFATITRRLDAAEEGVAKVCSMMDEFAKELHALRQQNEKTVTEVQALTDDMSLLQGSGASDASASRNKLQTLVEEFQALKTDVNENFAKCEDLEDLVTWQALEDSLKARIPDPPPPVPVPQPTTRQERVKSAKRAMPSREAMDALQQVGAVASKQEKLEEDVSELGDAMAGKLSIGDIADMMASKEQIDMIAGLQTRVTELENQLGQDMKREFESIKELVNKLKDTTAVDAERMAAMLSSHDENEQLIQDMSAQLVQQREQLAVLERTLDALQEANQAQSSVPPPTLDPEMVEGFRSQVGDISEEQRLLHDALEQLLQDLSESKQHIASIHQDVENLNHLKADKEFVALEVEDKADREMLEDKASRTWVDNHIKNLTEEILQAKHRVSGQDEKLQGALDQLSNDVEGKLDRLELEPLKQYLESKIQKTTVRPVDDGKQDAEWDAAGLKRGMLKFHCISCDRPVLMKADGHVNPLPIARSMRPQKIAVRPANIQELEAMRERQRRFVSGLDGSAPSSLLPSLRSCGGGHTMTHTSRRARLVPPIQSMYNSLPEPLLPPPPVGGSGLHEKGVIGHNGQMYRGRTSRANQELPFISPQGGKVVQPPRRPARSAKNARGRLPSPKEERRPVTSMDATFPTHQSP